MSDSVKRLDRALIARLGGDNAFAAMRRACAALLAEAQIDRTPTKLSSLVRHLGVNICYDSDALLALGQAEAALKVMDNKITLCVSRENFEKAPARARFSIAHELGHLILYKVLGPSFLKHCEDGPDAYQRAERLCDFAASHLLIPRSRLAEALRSRGFTAQGVTDIERIFDVSSTALLRAIADLVPEGSVLEWRHFCRNPREAKTWRVLRTYAPSAASDHSSWMPNGCTLKHVQGIERPDSLPPGEPVAHRNVTLTLGASKTLRDAVVCHWPLQETSLQYSITPRAQRETTGFVQDRDQGRLMMLVGKSGHVDYRQFGAELANESLHIRSAEGIA